MKMCQTCIDLGFAHVDLTAGAHICQIYNDDQEATDALRDVVRAGLQHHEHTACFSDRMDPDELLRYLHDQGLDPYAARDRQQLQVSAASPMYFPNQRFEPDRMLQYLQTFSGDARHQGRSARVIGEMSPKIHHMPGGSRLMEYESRVNLLLQEHPLTAICQYNARDFDGATILEVLNVHPMMLVRGNVLSNPFYIPPERYLQDHAHP